MTESYLWMCLWYTLCFIICLSAVHNYMSRGIISLAELSCWCPNTLFFSFSISFSRILYKLFQNGFIFRALNKKAMSSMTLLHSGTFTRSFSPSPTGEIGKTNKQYSSSVLHDRSQILLWPFPTGSVPDCLNHLFVIHSCNKFLLCDIMCAR